MKTLAIEEYISADLKQQSTRRFELEQNLCLISLLVLQHDPNVAAGDHRTVEDILRRPKKAWLPRLGLERYTAEKGIRCTESNHHLWEAFALRSSLDHSFRLTELRHHFHQLVREIDRNSHRLHPISADETISTDRETTSRVRFSWKENLSIVVLPLAIVVSWEVPDGFWDLLDHDLEQVRKWLQMSELFGSMVSVNEIRIALGSLEMLFRPPVPRDDPSSQVETIEDQRAAPIALGATHNSLAPLSQLRKRASSEVLVDDERQKSRSGNGRLDEAAADQRTGVDSADASIPAAKSSSSQN